MLSGSMLLNVISALVTLRKFEEFLQIGGCAGQAQKLNDIVSVSFLFKNSARYLF